MKKTILTFLFSVFVFSFFAVNCTAAPSMPIVKKGSKGTATYALQLLLKSKGYNINADGIAGTKTVNAIGKFQTSKGLTCDKIAGEKTFSAITPTLKINSSGDAVKALQYLLFKKFGFPLECTGYFGSNTYNCLKSFQKYVGITVDGIAGKTTWRYLLGYKSINLYSGGVSATTSKADIAINKAYSLIGSTAYDGLCQRFVRICFEDAGITGYADNALAAWYKWGISSSRTNIPKGAVVYFKTSSSYGHAGIYLGDGYVIHAVDTVKKESFSAMCSKYTFIGWGYQGGYKL